MTSAAAAGDGPPAAPAGQLRAPDADLVRTAQFWPFSPRPSYAPSAPERRDSAQYYYVRSRDMFGRPGPVYKVLGVEKRKRKSKRSQTASSWHKAKAAALLRKAPPPPPTKGPLLLAVSLSKQRITLFDAGIAVADSPISSGTPRNPTPTGIFSVIQKQWWHRSNLYSAAPMPFMQRLTWSGVALHAGELPGYPASHGCIRLPDEFAVRLWGTTGIGTRVIVTQNEIKPQPISHPKLFTPKLKPNTDPSDTPMASGEPDAPRPKPQEAVEPLPIALQGQIAVASVPLTPAVLDRAAAREGLEFLSRLDTPLTLVNPDGSPMADVMTDVEEAADIDEDDAGSDEPARKPTRITIVRPGQPDEVLDVAEAPDITDEGLATITVLRGGRPAEIEVIAVSKVAPEPKVALRLPEPEPPLVVAHNGVVTAGLAARRLRQARPLPIVPPAPAPQARPLRPGPISVFVSRKERRMFVRKGFEPLFDVPVTISNPERPLGEHIFTAMAVGEADAHWNAISLPVERVRQVRRTVEYGRGRHKRRAHRWQSEVVSAPPPASAAEALDRIDIPPEALTRISELMSVGATLIVSDQGLGRETGRETDFTVVTK